MASVTKEVKEFGNGAHVVVPKRLRGRKVKVEPVDESED